MKNSTRRHDIVSYKYLIVDKDGYIVAHKLETGGGNVGRKMIDNITRDFKNLRRHMEKNWNREPVLTLKDQEIYDVDAYLRVFRYILMQI